MSSLHFVGFVLNRQTIIVRFALPVALPGWMTFRLKYFAGSAAFIDDLHVWISPGTLNPYPSLS